MLRSAKSTLQVTVAVTWAVVPSGALNAPALTVMLVVVHCRPWSLRLLVAADFPELIASLWVRSIEAARAAS